MKEVIPEDALIFTDVGWNKNGVAQDGIAVTWVVMNNSAFGTIAGLENANYHHKFGTVFHTPDGESYTPNWADVAKAYGIESIRCSSAEEWATPVQKPMGHTRAGRPFLVEAPMENIVVPTPGCWNINDIYTPNELVKEGKLVKKENGQYVAPSHSKSHNAK